MEAKCSNTDNSGTGLLRDLEMFWSLDQLCNSLYKKCFQSEMYIGDYRICTVQTTFLYQVVMEVKLKGKPHLIV